MTSNGHTRIKHPVRRRVMFAAFRAVWGTVRWLPWTVVFGLGYVLGLAAYAVLGRFRRLALEHLREAFGPGLSDATARRIARGVFINLARNVLEWPVLDRLSPAQLTRYVEVRGLSHLRQALAAGRGVLAVSAHFGDWEVLAMTLASHGFEGGVLARRLRYPEYEKFLRGMRAKKQVATYDRESLRDVTKTLRANRIIGLMPDQDIDSLDGVFVDFFGRPAYTPVGPAALALLSGAAILPCFVIRNGRHVRVVIEPPIDAPRTGDRMKDVLLLTQAWSRAIEAMIRCYPDHWVWMHRRWKTRPLTEQLPQHAEQETAECAA